MNWNTERNNDGVPHPRWTIFLPWILLIATSLILVLVVQKKCSSNSSQDNRVNESAATTGTVGPSQGIIDLERALGNATAESREFTLDGLTFVQGSAQLDTVSNHALNQLLIILNQYPSVHIRLEGYCRQQSNTKANLRISHQRAVAVTNYLKEQGISANRLRAVGRGESRRTTPVESSQSSSSNELIGLIVESQ